MQSSTVSTITSGTSIQASWPQATASGNLLVALISFNTWPANPSITPPAGWTEAVRSDAATTARAGAVIYYILNAASRSGAEQFTLSADCDCSLELLEYHDSAAGTWALDQVAEQIDTTGSWTASSGTTPTTTANNEVCIALINSRPNGDAGPPYDADQSSPTNSFSMIGQTESRNDPAGVHAGSYERIVSSTGTYGTSVSLVAGCYWAGCIATFSATSAPAVAQLIVIGQAVARSSRW